MYICTMYIPSVYGLWQGGNIENEGREPETDSDFTALRNIQKGPGSRVMLFSTKFSYLLFNILQIHSPPFFKSLGHSWGRHDVNAPQGFFFYLHLNNTTQYAHF